MKRKRVSLSVRCVQVPGFGRIPLDICWGNNHDSLEHVHNLKYVKPGTLPNGPFKTIVESSLNPRWCAECVRNYTQSTRDSRAFYEVVRLNGNSFAGNLPMELIYKIYEELLKPKLIFTECSKLTIAE